MLKYLAQEYFLPHSLLLEWFIFMHYLYFLEFLPDLSTDWNGEFYLATTPGVQCQM